MDEQQWSPLQGIRLFVWLITIIKDATDELKLVLLLEQYYSFAMMTLYLGTVSVCGLFIFLSDSSVPSPGGFFKFCL